jgi:hypothetical protein
LIARGNEIAVHGTIVGGLINNDWRLAATSHMRELVLRRICGISSAQFVAKNRGILAHGEVFQCESECALDVLHRCSLAWIISANRMLSEIFAVTDGEGLISSRFSRTAAIKRRSNENRRILPVLLVIRIIWRIFYPSPL